METAMRKISKISRYLPLYVLVDVEKRCTDWMASGGKEDDPYIRGQLAYAQHFVPKEVQ